MSLGHYFHGRIFFVISPASNGLHVAPAKSKHDRRTDRQRIPMWRFASLARQKHNHQKNVKITLSWFISPIFKIGNGVLHDINETWWQHHRKLLPHEVLTICTCQIWCSRKHVTPPLDTGLRLVSPMDCSHHEKPALIPQDPSSLLFRRWKDNI